VLASTIAPPSGPPARPIASTTRDPAGNRYTPGRRTGPGDIDHDVSTATGDGEAARRRRSDGLCRSSTSSLCPDRTHPDEQQGGRDRAVDDHLRTGDIEHGPSVDNPAARVARAINRFGYRSSSSS
jgi:hypothetical protein